MPSPPGTTRSLIAAILVLAALPAASAEVVIDSFTDPLPPHPLLTASGRPILYLGEACDGASCPPATLVRNEPGVDDATQTGLPGVLQGMRRLGIFAYTDDHPYGGGNAETSIDPSAGGRWNFERASDAPCGAFCHWGAASDPLDLDLPALGIDRFEIEFLAVPGNGVSGLLELQSYGANGAQDDYAYAPFSAAGPGVVSIPLSALRTVLVSGGVSVDDVDAIELAIHPHQGPAAIAIGEVRMATAAVPSGASTWGRVKATYLR
jgi:hypothetical protein